MRPGAALALVGVVAVGAAALWRASTDPEPQSPLLRAPSVSAPDARVRVEVLNGGGQSGAARRATEQLRDAGFDVVLLGNAERFDQDSSVVYDRVGRMKWAEAVAEALGIHNVESLPDTNLYVDVSVVLGRDWRGEGSAEPPGGVPPS